MKVVETDLPGCLVIEPEVYGDERGFFLETWNRERYARHGIGPDFVQSNLSRSARGVLRGLHYQWPKPQGKLVSVHEGEVYDVAVDIRRGSPTFGRWTAVMLSAENRRQFWIPEGFAHGFVALSEFAQYSYMCTAAYDAGADANVAWNDATIGIDWPVAAPSLSGKDGAAPLLKDIAPARLPEYPGTS
ncbi:MAG: dTDP-4-dehydrorhamnose 3,5-epimerase [Lysobacter sp.]